MCCLMFRRSCCPSPGMLLMLMLLGSSSRAALLLDGGDELLWTRKEWTADELKLGLPASATAMFYSETVLDGFDLVSTRGPFRLSHYDLRCLLQRCGALHALPDIFHGGKSVTHRQPHRQPGRGPVMPPHACRPQADAAPHVGACRRRDGGADAVPAVHAAGGGQLPAGGSLGARGRARPHSGQAGQLHAGAVREQGARQRCAVSLPLQAGHTMPPCVPHTASRTHDAAFRAAYSDDRPALLSWPPWPEAEGPVCHSKRFECPCCLHRPQSSCWGSMQSQRLAVWTRRWYSQ